MKQWTRRGVFGAAFAWVLGAGAQPEHHPRAGEAAANNRLGGPGSRIDRGWLPALAVDARTGTLHVAYGQGKQDAGDIFIRRSSDGGSRFSPPLRINHVAGEVSGHDQAPPLLRAGADGALYALWSASRRQPGWRYGKSELRFARSSDGGASFTPAQTLADDGADVSRAFHDMTVSSDGTLHVLFRPESKPAETVHAHHGPAQMRITVSRDGGASFEPSRLVAAAVCECCRPALAQAPGGRVFAAWRDATRGSAGKAVRDIAVAVYDQQLAPEVAAHVAVADGWAYDACPHAGPAVAAVGKRLFVGWFSGQGPRPGLRLSCSDDGGRTFAAATELLGDTHVPPSLVAFAPASDRALWVAWEDLREAQPRIHLGLLPTTGTLSAPPSRLQVAGRYPALAVGNERLYMVWTQGDDARLLVIQP